MNLSKAFQIFASLSMQRVFNFKVKVEKKRRHKIKRPHIFHYQKRSIDYIA
jgi:hypothetical protein